MIVTLLSSMSPFILTALAAPGNEAAGTDMDEPFNILVAHYFRDGQISAPLYCTQPGDAKGKKRLRSGSESVVQDAEGGQREIKRSKSEDPVKKKISESESWKAAVRRLQCLLLTYPSGPNDDAIQNSLPSFAETWSFPVESKSCGFINDN